MLDITKLRDEANALLRDIDDIRNRLLGLNRLIDASIEKPTAIEFLKGCSVHHPIRGIIPFEPYAYQEKTIEELERGFPITVVMSARQMGMSVIMANYALFVASTKPNSTIVVISNDLACSKEFISRAVWSIEGNPPHVPSATISSQGINFSNGSRIIAKPANINHLRGTSIDLLIVDNAAFISHKSLYDVWQNYLPCVLTTGKIILTSCPNTSEGLFHDLWRREDDKVNKILVKWRDHPERDEAWGEAFRQQLGWAAFQREFECQFVDDIK